MLKIKFMKSLKISLIALTASILIFSCSKEEFLEISEPKDETVQFILDNVPYISNPNNVSLYTENKEDVDDEKINKQLLDIAIATRDFLKESPQNQTVLKSANISANSSVNLYDLVSNSALKSSYQSAAYANLVTLLENVNLTHSSTNPFKIRRN